MLPLALLIGLFVIVVVLCRPVSRTNEGRALCAMLIFALAVVLARVLAGTLPDAVRPVLLIGLGVLAVASVGAVLFWPKKH